MKDSNESVDVYTKTNYDFEKLLMPLLVRFKSLNPGKVKNEVEKTIKSL